MEKDLRRQRAETRRQSMQIRKTRLARVEQDMSPIRGAEAIALGWQLTRESWSVAGLDLGHDGQNRSICRFVPRRAA